MSGKATVLSNIGVIYKAQGNYPKALKRFEEAQQIAEQIGDLSLKAGCLANIGVIYYAKGNYPKALKYMEKALQILTQLGLSETPAAKMFKENIEALKKIMK